MGDIGEKEFFERVNPDDVESILKSTAVDKIPRREVSVKNEEQETKKRKEKNNDSDPMNLAKHYIPKTLRRGDIITVAVVKLEPDGIMVNAGGKGDYFIPIRELSLQSISSPKEVVKVGDKIDIYVVKDRNAKGNAILSKKKADYVEKWQELKERFNRTETVEAKVMKAIKGGLLTDVEGIVAFLPQSQVGLKKGETLESYVGKEFDVKLLEVDPSIRRIVVSRRDFIREEKENERKEALVNLKKGDIVEGVVRTIKDFGIFVDIGHNIDGFVRLSELTWGRRKLPKDVVRRGEEVKVKILSVNLQTEKVSLSLRQAKPYPWDIVDEKFPVDSIVEGTVIRIHPFGAVVELDDGITGLIHISQLDTKRVNKVDDIVKLGDEVKVKVLAIDKENKKMRLSRRAAIEEENDE